VRKTRWAVWISGTGSNLGALLEMSDFCEVGLVVSSKKTAAGLLKAKRAMVRTLILEKNVDWESLHKLHLENQIDAIYLAGFMKIVPPVFIDKWKNRIVNVHPSLLPDYPGLESIERAYQDGNALGATVHRVVKEVDAGEKLFQMKTQTVLSLDDSARLVHLSEQKMARKVLRSWKRLSM
jgi:phosphoribosylglycinamide formyltransferase-1